MLRRLVCILVLVLGALETAVAQDSRGGLVPDTRVELMTGTALVQDLSVGQEILTLGSDGKAQPGKITAIRRRHADSYILLKAGVAQLQATDSHRVALPDGKIVRLDTVADGDKVLIWGPKGQTEQTASVREYPANMICYNLTVEGHRLFVAGGIVVGD